MNIITAWIYFCIPLPVPIAIWVIPLHLRSFVTCVGRTMNMEVALLTAVECTFSAPRWVRLEMLRHPPFWSTRVFHVRC